jgi:hypothetical protein
MHRVVVNQRQMEWGRYRCTLVDVHADCATSSSSPASVLHRSAHLPFAFPYTMCLVSMLEASIDTF